MKRFKPPTLEEIEQYVAEKKLCIDPKFFLEFFEEGNWHDSRGNPVKNWKQKILTWHRQQIDRGGAHRCSHGSYGSCKNPGVYPVGKDRDGHPLYRCIKHKPIEKPVLPKNMTENLLKVVPDGTIDVNNERNKQLKRLKGKQL